MDKKMSKVCYRTTCLRYIHSKNLKNNTEYYSYNNLMKCIMYSINLQIQHLRILDYSCKSKLTKLTFDQNVSMLLKPTAPEL